MLVWAQAGSLFGVCECVCLGEEGTGLSLAACSVSSSRGTACSGWCCSLPVLLHSSAWQLEQKGQKMGE